MTEHERHTWRPGLWVCGCGHNNPYEPIGLTIGYHPDFYVHVGVELRKLSPGAEFFESC